MKMGVLPAEVDGDDASAILGDLEEHWHGEIEVGSRRVAPPAIITRQSKVRRAEISSGNKN